MKGQEKMGKNRSRRWRSGGGGKKNPL